MYTKTKAHTHHKLSAHGSKSVDSDEEPHKLKKPSLSRSVANGKRSRSLSLSDELQEVEDDPALPALAPPSAAPAAAPDAAPAAAPGAAPAAAPAATGPPPAPAPPPFVTANQEAANLAAQMPPGPPIPPTCQQVDQTLQTAFSGQRLCANTPSGRNPLLPDVKPPWPPTLQYLTASAERLTDDLIQSVCCQPVCDLTKCDNIPGQVPKANVADVFLAEGGCCEMSLTMNCNDYKTRRLPKGDPMCTPAFFSTVFTMLPGQATALPCLKGSQQLGFGSVTGLCCAAIPPGSSSCPAGTTLGG